MRGSRVMRGKARKGGWHGVRNSLITKHLSAAFLQGKGGLLGCRESHNPTSHLEKTIPDSAWKGD